MTYIVVGKTEQLFRSTRTLVVHRRFLWVDVDSAAAGEVRHPSTSDHCTEVWNQVPFICAAALPSVLSQSGGE